MKHIILLGVVFSFATAGGMPFPGWINASSHEIIDYINSINTTWKAGRNFDERIALEYMKGLMDVDDDDDEVIDKDDVVHRLSQINDAHLWDIPESFDAREKWPQCDSISTISDQGSCGSCWAVAATGTMSDRICIASKGKEKAYLSAEDLLSCCEFCGKGCNGGKSTKAWEYWKTNGIVTGGLYGTQDGCKPYSIGRCKRQEGSNCTRAPTPECVHTCREGYNVSYTNDKYYGSRPFIFLNPHEQDMQYEIMIAGPVQASFRVYKDFHLYKSGVYKSHFASPEYQKGRHSVRILGWGVDNGVKYWLVANSWSTNWGENGYFRILRGENECGIEEKIRGGDPVLKKS